MPAIGNRARLGIPKVNVAPRVSAPKVALKNRARKPVRGQTQTIQPVPGSKSDPVSPVATANASAPVTPVAPATPSAASDNPFQIPAYSGANDPRDATYWAAANKLVFNSQQEYNNNLREQANADASYNMALKLAIQNRALQERNLGLANLSNGLTASGYHDRTDAQQTTDYLNERAQAELSKSQEDQARAAAKKALIEGFGIDHAALMAEAAGRYDAAKANEAQSGAPETPAEQVAKKAANAKKGKGKSSTPKVGISANKPLPKIAVGKAKKVKTK